MSIRDNVVEQTYKTLDKEADEFGEVKISESVVASIAGLAALEVKGVDSMIGSVATEIAGKLGVKNLDKGIRAAIEDNDVIIDMNINMLYGYNILATCKQVQDKVKQSVESMTGLNCSKININISGISIEK